MDQSTQLFILLVAASVGVLAMLVMFRRQRSERAAETRESTYATSSEGQKRCPNCGAYNAWTDRNCVNCGKLLRG